MGPGNATAVSHSETAHMQKIYKTICVPVFPAQRRDTCFRQCFGNGTQTTLLKEAVSGSTEAGCAWVIEIVFADCITIGKVPGGKSDYLAGIKISDPVLFGQRNRDSCLQISPNKNKTWFFLLPHPCSTADDNSKSYPVRFPDNSRNNTG